MICVPHFLSINPFYFQGPQYQSDFYMALNKSQTSHCSACKLTTRACMLGNLDKRPERFVDMRVKCVQDLNQYLLIPKWGSHIFNVAKPTQGRHSFSAFYEVVKQQIWLKRNLYFRSWEVHFFLILQLLRSLGILFSDSHLPVFLVLVDEEVISKMNRTHYLSPLQSVDLIKD